MQVLVLIVQNAVPYSELGVATSGATFFRSIGGSFGTAIFGAIFANVLVGNLVRHLGHAKLPSGLSSVERHPGHPRPASRRCPPRPRRRLRRIDPDRLPHRRPDRLPRLPRLVAHPRSSNYADRSARMTAPRAKPQRQSAPTNPARPSQHRIQTRRDSPSNCFAGGVFSGLDQPARRAFARLVSLLDDFCGGSGGSDRLAREPLTQGRPRRLGNLHATEVTTLRSL